MITLDLPDGRVSTEVEVIAAHSHDRSGWIPEGSAAAVAFARSTEDVQTVLRFAHATGTPVVPRGAGTGLSGGAGATAGCIVLDLSGLDRIRSISPVDQLAVVEAGVITDRVDRAAGEHGLRYAPDPASSGISTIGGNIATNAGGLRCAKYGVTRDSVLGLEVVLADGRLINTGRATIKGVTGYDLTGLFVGSEGNSGVVVAATLRLRPMPAATATVAAFFDDVSMAAAASAAIGAAGLQPAVAELLDAATLRAIDDAQGTEYSGRGGAFLLVQTDGLAAELEADLVEKVITGFASHVERTSDPVEADRLIALRRLALPSLERRGRVLIEDIAVPRSRLADAVAGIAAISRTHDVPVFTMAHAADGNLHPIVVLENGQELDESVWNAAGAIFAMALAMGGTLTGEHGVGVLKRRWLVDEIGADSLRLQQDLRAVFDPASILNPGKAN